MPDVIHGFTFEASGVPNRIITPVRIAPPSKKLDPNSSSVIQVNALWDTGASASVITPSAVKTLGLVSVGTRDVEGFGGVEASPVHIIDLFLSDLLAFTSLFVAESVKDNGGFEFIIGMDVISAGDFSICQNGGNSVVSYQFPSTHRFDFGKEVLQRNVKVYLKALKKMDPRATVTVLKIDSGEMKSVKVRQAKTLVQKAWALT